MFHSTLGMPWNKEQVENRLSKVRNQSSILIPDGRDVVLVVMVNVSIPSCAHVHTEIRQCLWRFSPTGPKAVPTRSHCCAGWVMLFQIILLHVYWLFSFWNITGVLNCRLFFFFCTVYLKHFCGNIQDIFILCEAHNYFYLRIYLEFT